MLFGLLIDISSQHSFKGLGLKAPLDNQSALTIKRTACTQLSQQEQLHMLGLPVHRLAELHVVCEHSLLGAFTSNLDNIQKFS